MNLNLIWPEAVIVSCNIIVKIHLYSLVLVVVVDVAVVVVGAVVNFDEVVMN